MLFAANEKSDHAYQPKGGVRKTTTAVKLGIGLAQKGEKILLIGADAQGNLTDSLGWIEPNKLPVSPAAIMSKVVMEEQIDPDEDVLHHEEGVDLMPANIELSAMEADALSFTNLKAIWVDANRQKEMDVVCILSESRKTE